jgi:hypothetical protein
MNDNNNNKNSDSSGWNGTTIREKSKMQKYEHFLAFKVSWRLLGGTTKNYNEPR